MVAPDVGAEARKQYMMTMWMGLNIVAILFNNPGRNLGALDLLKAQHQLQTRNANPFFIKDGLHRAKSR